MEACILCHRNTKDSAELGRLYIKSRTGLSSHYHCLVFSTLMQQRGKANKGIKGFLESDIRDMLEKIKSQTCMFCGRGNANIQCCYSGGCDRVFHLPCGLEGDALHQFFNDFKSYCPKHRPRQEVVVSAVLPEQCRICLQGWARIRKLTSPLKMSFSVKETTNQRDDEALWAPCCKFIAAFHRQCVKRMAETSGYLFRCPCCNNKEDFMLAMQTLGIYVPQDDPAWHLEREAFQEMRQPPRLLCSAKPCVCTNGPEYQRKSTLWEMAKCMLCASEAIHKGCSDLQLNLNDWQCYSCSIIVAPGEYYKMDVPMSTRLSEECTKRKLDELDMPSTSTVNTLPRATIKRRRPIAPKSVKERTTMTRASSSKGDVSETSSTSSEPEEKPTTPLAQLLCSAVFKVGVNGVREIHSQLFGVFARAQCDDEPWL